MNKKIRYAHSCVWQGWWPILDKYIPAILAIDPDCDFEPKEKFAELRLQATCSANCEPEKRKEIWRLEQEAEDLSQTICEYCGKPGKPRTDRSWMKTLCDICDGLDKDGAREVFLEHHRRMEELEE